MAPPRFLSTLLAMLPPASPLALLPSLTSLTAAAAPVLTSSPAAATALHLCIGGVAGSAGALSVYPLDLIKTRLQSEEGKARFANGLEAARDVLARDGPLGFFHGVSTQLVGVAPEKAIKLSVYAAVSGAACWHGAVPLHGQVLAGWLAGLSQTVVTNPLEVVKVRMQLGGGRAGELLRELRWGGLYTGLEATALRDSTFSAILFPINEHIKPLLLSQLGADHAFFCSLLAGMIAATPAAFLTTPADLVKTRMQQGRELLLAQQGACVPGFAPPPSFGAVATQVLREEGAATFFDGCAERVARSAPQFGVTLAMLDLMNDFCLAHGLVL